MESLPILHALSVNWQETGICPDPRAYEVVPADKPDDPHYRDFLFLGHDANVVVTARDYTVSNIS